MQTISNISSDSQETLLMIVYEGHCVVGSAINDSIFQDAPKIVSRTMSTCIVEIHMERNVKERRLQVMR